MVGYSSPFQEKGGGDSAKYQFLGARLKAEYYGYFCEIVEFDETSPKPTLSAVLFANFPKIFTNIPNFFTAFDAVKSTIRRLRGRHPPRKAYPQILLAHTHIILRGDFSASN